MAETSHPKSYEVQYKLAGTLKHANMIVSCTCNINDISPGITSHFPEAQRNINYKNIFRVSRESSRQPAILSFICPVISSCYSVERAENFLIIKSVFLSAICGKICSNFIRTNYYCRKLLIFVHGKEIGITRTFNFLQSEAKR